jgi:hypothetical protein
MHPERKGAQKYGARQAAKGSIFVGTAVRGWVADLAHEDNSVDKVKLTREDLATGLADFAVANHINP